MIRPKNTAELIDSEGHTGLRAGPCPACAGLSYKVLLLASDRRFRTTSQQFQLAECKDCRLIRTEPQPTPEELRQYYPPPGLSFSRKQAKLSVGAVIEKLAFRAHIKFLERALRESGEEGLVLDVGCGDGRFLGLLRDRGIERLAGLDFSLDAASIAWRQQGMPAVCGTLSKPPFAPASCSAITMFQVLQHLYSPIAFLDAARDLLAPEGRLILQVPNIACWQFLLFGDRWTGLDLPRQLIHFKTPDIERLLEDCGFEVLRREHFSLSDNPETLVSSLFPTLDPAVRAMRHKSESAAMRISKIFAHHFLFILGVPFAAFEAACHAGSTVMFEARKKR